MGAGCRLSIVHVRQHLLVDRPMRLRGPQQVRDLVLRSASLGGEEGRDRGRDRGQSKSCVRPSRSCLVHKTKYPPWSNSLCASSPQPRCPARQMVGAWPECHPQHFEGLVSVGVTWKERRGEPLFLVCVPRAACIREKERSNKRLV